MFNYPKKVFNDANNDVGCYGTGSYGVKKDNFGFGEALQKLKQGLLVCRSGWNGKGMFLLIVYGETVMQSINQEYNLNSSGNTIECLDAIYMFTADKKLVPWLASQTDILADDWMLAPFPKN